MQPIRHVATVKCWLARARQLQRGEEKSHSKAEQRAAQESAAFGVIPDHLTRQAQDKLEKSIETKGAFPLTRADADGRC